MTIAEDRVAAGGEESRGLESERRRYGVADEVDASMDGVQPAALDAVHDRLGAEPAYY